MTQQHEAVVDFIAGRGKPDEWQMVLVEAGPWEGNTLTQLRRIQTRLLECVEATLVGKLTEWFPEATGKWVLIALDCYGGPQDDIERLFHRITKGLLTVDDYQQRLQEQAFVRGIRFELNFGTFPL